MRYSELAAQPVQEAPMGFFSKLGNQIASKLGSAMAQGRLEAGQVANYLYKQFLKNLGASGQQPTPEVLAGFLQSAGVPKQSIQAAKGKVIGQADVKTDPTTGQATLTASADLTANLNRKQIGQLILSAVQHANQAGTLSFGDNADTGGQTVTARSQPQQKSSSSLSGTSVKSTETSPSDRMDTGLKQLHAQVLKGDVQAAKDLVQSLSDINQMVKRHANAANKSIGRGVQDHGEREKLVKQVRTIATESYNHLTRVFDYANITWQQVGYRPDLRENVQGKIVLMPINTKNPNKRSQ